MQSPEFVIPKTWCKDNVVHSQKIKEHLCGQPSIAVEVLSDDDSITTYESEIDDQLQPYIEVEDSESINGKYNDLQSSVMSVSNDNYNSFLLPSLLPDHGSVKVTVKGVNDTVLMAAAEASASKYIKQMVEERNNAVKLTLHYRDLVEDLQSKNRKLHCTMNDRADTIRRFWRNSILESGSRGGLCMMKALHNVSI